MVFAVILLWLASLSAYCASKQQLLLECPVSMLSGWGMYSLNFFVASFLLATINDWFVKLSGLRSWKLQRRRELVEDQDSDLTATLDGSSSSPAT